jgi:hypothetical protein
MLKEVRDITVKSRYHQRDIKEYEEPVKEKRFTDIPLNVTIEAAIGFYTNHAQGELGTLYKRTASWLRLLLQKKT